MKSDSTNQCRTCCPSSSELSYDWLAGAGVPENVWVTAYLADGCFLTGYIESVIRVCGYHGAQLDAVIEANHPTAVPHDY